MQDASSSSSFSSDDLPKDPTELRALLLQQRALVNALQDAMSTLEKDRDQWRSQAEAYKTWAEKLARIQYGRRSERDDPNQRVFDFAVAPEAADDLADAVDEAMADAERTLDEEAKRRGVKRKPRRAKTTEFPAHLPRIVEEIEPPEGKAVCDEHGPKKLMGFDETNTLEYEPPKLFVRVRRYKKYICEKAPECGVAQAPRPPALVEGNRYDISVAVAVILAKYFYHLPLYREQDLLASCGWTPSHSTLVNLLEASSELASPLVDFIRNQVLSGELLGCDDTTVTLITPPFPPAIDEARPRSARTREVLAAAIAVGQPSVVARIWAYRSLTAPLNFFDFTVSRHRDGPAEILAGFRGTLMADCYAGFESIAVASDARIVRAACWAHARRKFFEIQKNHPQASATMLAMIRELYDIEDRARTMAPDERRGLRERESQPVLERIRAFLFGPIYEAALPKSQLRAAMNYVRNHWPELQTFLRDGRCPIDNNETEQLMKQVAIGRNNWLFMGSVAGGERAARLMTLVSSALRNDLDVHQYLVDVLRRLLDGLTDYQSLLPHVWRESHPEAVRTYRVDERRDAVDRQTARRAERRQQGGKPRFTRQQKAVALARKRADAKVDSRTHRRPRPERRSET